MAKRPKRPRDPSQLGKLLRTYRRQNLTMRMSIRRFARLTNAFSKKVENHALSVALHYMNYNFCRIHKTLRVTPAVAAGVTDRLWGISDIVKVLEEWEAAQAAS